MILRHGLRGGTFCVVEHKTGFLLAANGASVVMEKMMWQKGLVLKQFSLYFSELKFKFDLYFEEKKNQPKKICAKLCPLCSAPAEMLLCGVIKLYRFAGQVTT